MGTNLFMELRRIFAELASTLILGKNKDAADIAMALSEKSRALAEELAKQNCLYKPFILDKKHRLTTGAFFYDETIIKS